MKRCGHLRRSSIPGGRAVTALSSLFGTYGGAACCRIQNRFLNSCTHISSATTTTTPTSSSALRLREVSTLRRREHVPAARASPATDCRESSPIPFTKVGGKCDAVDYQIFTFLLSALRHYGLSTEIRLTGGWIRDRLMCPERTRPQGMDFVLSDTQGSVFCKLLTDYSRKSKRGKQGEEGLYIEAKGNRWSVWLLNRELRFQQRVAPSWAEEAYRSDFTINSLFYNLHDQTIEDYTNMGLTDMTHQLLRTPGPAISSLIYDHVRVLRAIRFHRAYDLTLDPELDYALQHPKVQASFAARSSKSARQAIELRKMLTHKNNASMYEDLARFNLHQSLFAFPKSLSYVDTASENAKTVPSALSAFSSLPPLAAELSLPVNGWSDSTTTKAVNSVSHLRKLLSRSKELAITEDMALLLAFVSPSLLANWSGYNPFSHQLASTTVSVVKSCLSLPPTWARELRELLNATVDLLHMAHDFIPTIHAFHALMAEDDPSELRAGYDALVNRRRHDLLHWYHRLKDLDGELNIAHLEIYLRLRQNKDIWRIATLVAHTMLIHGSPQYQFDWRLFEQALVDSGVAEAAYTEPLLNGNEIKELLPQELHGRSVGELKEALVSWQWEADHPTREGAVAFVRQYIRRASSSTPSLISTSRQ